MNGVPDGPTEMLDDIAAFLMHRTQDPGVTDSERLATFTLVGAYQERDAPTEIESALRTAAAKFADHPDYRPQWRPR